VSDHVLAEKSLPIKNVSIPSVKRNLNPHSSVMKSLKKRLSSIKGSKNVYHDDVNVLWKTSLKLSSASSASLLPSNIALALDAKKVFVLDSAQLCIAIFKKEVEVGTLSLRNKSLVQYRR
jgi:hypothetical protein